VSRVADVAVLAAHKLFPICGPEQPRSPPRDKRDIDEGLRPPTLAGWPSWRWSRGIFNRL